MEREKNKLAKSTSLKSLLSGLCSDNYSVNLSAKEEFFYQYRQTVFKLCINRAKLFKNGYRIAEDISQEVILKVYDKIHTFNRLEDDEIAFRKQFLKWISMIVKHAFIDYYRKDNDEKCFDLVIDEGYEIKSKDEVIEKKPTIEQAKLQLALESLTERELRIILTYYDFYDDRYPRKHLPDNVIASLCKEFNTSLYVVNQI